VVQKIWRGNVFFLGFQWQLIPTHISFYQIIFFLTIFLGANNCLVSSLMVRLLYTFIRKVIHEATILYKLRNIGIWIIFFWMKIFFRGVTIVFILCILMLLFFVKGVRCGAFLKRLILFLTTS